MAGKIIPFPVQNRWYDKLSWHRARNVARLLHLPSESWETPSDKEAYIMFLITHIWGMLNEWEPRSRLEDLPPEVREWYLAARRIEAEGE